MTTGYLRLFRIGGMPISMHWSVLVLAAYVIGTRDHALATLLAYLTVIIVHELGHALLVRKYRLRVHELQVHPFGGECRHNAAGTRREDTVIAWGGVLAQLALVALAFALLRFMPALPESHPELGVFIARLTLPNLVMAAINLLPIRPLDGYRAWRLGTLRARERTRDSGSRSGREPRPLQTGEHPPELTDVGPPPRDKKKSKPARPLSIEEQTQLGALVDDALERARSERKPRD